MSSNQHPIEEDDQPLHLHTRALLDALAQARASANVADLRHSIATLIARLDAAEDELHAIEDGEDVVTIEQPYLLGELEQVTAAQTLERARYYLDRLVKSVTEERTSAINDININRWKTYDEIITDSLWNIDKRDSSGAHTANYWGNFIPQIPRQMMLRYTKHGDWVLDTFAGSGTTLIEGQRLGRNTLGVELQAHVATESRERIAAEPNIHNVVAEIVTGDSATADYAALLAHHGQRSAQLVIMHPPYFDIIAFSDDERDLSNAASVEIFLEHMGTIIQRAAAVLDKGRYLALVIGDKYTGGEWIPLGFRTMNVVLQHGFTLKSIVVKNFDQTAGKRSQKELWKYRALVGGFYVFKHEYIFVFKKR